MTRLTWSGLCAPSMTLSLWEINEKADFAARGAGCQDGRDSLPSSDRVFGGRAVGDRRNLAVQAGSEPVSAALCPAHLAGNLLPRLRGKPFVSLSFVRADPAEPVLSSPGAIRGRGLRVVLDHPYPAPSDPGQDQRDALQKFVLLSGGGDCDIEFYLEKCDAAGISYGTDPLKGFKSPQGILCFIASCVSYETKPSGGCARRAKEIWPR